jgi:hypothetical protein
VIVQRAARMLPVDSIYREFFVWGIKKKCIFAFESGVWVKGVAVYCIEDQEEKKIRPNNNKYKIML